MSDAYDTPYRVTSSAPDPEVLDRFDPATVSGEITVGIGTSGRTSQGWVLVKEVHGAADLVSYPLSFRADLAQFEQVEFTFDAADLSEPPADEVVVTYHPDDADEPAPEVPDA